MKIMKMDTGKFATRLRELRTEKCGSMDAFVEKFNKATDLSISKSTVSRWETGTAEPLMSSLILLADYFCVSPDYLIGRSCDRLGYPIEPEKTKAEILKETCTPEEFEELRLFALLDIKGKTKVLSLLYELNEK